MKFFCSLALLLFIFLSLTAGAQFPSGKGNNDNNPMMNVGHFYGKVVDSTSGRPVEFASVQLWADKADTITKTMKPTLITGMITKPNGDFSFEGLPVLDKFVLKINFIGYVDFEKNISFNVDATQMMKQGGPNMKSMLNVIDKDLGNIKLSPNVSMLGPVVVDGSPPLVELKFDKKVFNVEKNITTAGGTAEDVLKSVPSVNVDIDGNVQVRNSSPQIFVDGKPTTLTLDQIPAEAIESVELITNPSAKYDAGGGQGGILNIVMKKTRRIGYSGNIRAGMDMRGKMNLGGDFNSRQGKINIFLNFSYNQRKSIMDGETQRYNLIGSPLTDVFQTDHTVSNGYFFFGRAGMDWFLDNRNTITISTMYPTGKFTPVDVLNEHTDSILDGGSNSSSYIRNASTSSNFSNTGGSLQYKHNFPKAGQELTADFTHNMSIFTTNSLFATQYYDVSNNASGGDILQQQNGSGNSHFTTAQIDYVNPVGDKAKIETGLRASVADFENRTYNYLFNDTINDYSLLTGQNDNYKYSYEVYAGYINFSQKINKFNYQAGLRLESSMYNGLLIDSGRTFSNQYPLSIFPTASVTYALNAKDNLQLSYSRRVNRPTFYQLMPFTNYADSLNLTSGNANLKPEFTNSFELSHLLNFDNANNLLTSLWYKNTTDLITRYQVREYNAVLGDTATINTYENANSSNSYGIEITSTNSVSKLLTLTSNVNFYNSNINGTNLQSGLTNQQISWFAKEILNIKLPKNFSLQITGSYQSRTAVPAGSGSGNERTYGGFGSSLATLQGYIDPIYYVDAALRFEFMKNKAASLTFNGSDILKTRKTDAYSESLFFTQNTSRTRDQQFFRIVFSYRFGKFDASLFKRKNTKVNTEGMDNIQDQ